MGIPYSSSSVKAAFLRLEHLLESAFSTGQVSMAAALTFERSTYWKAAGSLWKISWKDLLVAVSARRDERGR